MLLMEMIPQAIAIAVTMIAAIWAMTHGATIGASAEVEKKSSVWGAALNAFGGFLLIVDLLFVIVLIFGGGEGGMIPESAWPLLTGALTMIGAGFAAALCIMVAAKSGAEMLTERPELSIWSLLFVALGEGLAIYGLIVAILLSSG
jgi:V/A-type H+-transporting ATPase subunit K